MPTEIEYNLTNHVTLKFVDMKLYEVGAIEVEGGGYGTLK